MIEVKIPSPGESITEVEIANWLVETGDYVEKDQEIAEIESDKATLPLVAEESGKVEIVAPEGETIKVGEVACKIDETAKKEEKSKSEEEQQTTKEEKTEAPEPEKQSAASEEKREEETKKETEKAPKDKESETQKESDQVKVSPVAEKMMEDYDLSLDDVLKGLRRLNKKDIEKAREGLSMPEAEETSKKEASRDADRKKMSQLRKKLSQRLVSVKNETAMLTTFNEVDMTEVINLRKKYQKQFQEKHGIKLGFMSFFTKAATKALETYPNINSRIEGEEIVYPKYNDIGIAVQTSKGLMVPVIRNAESMTLAEIEIKVNEFAEKARNNRIKIDEMEGGTFTITNGGVFGSMLSTPILNPPQSGILGMHNIQERPVAINGQVVIRPMMYIALSYDHRTVDGKDSVSFLVKVKEMIENPYKMLLNDNPDKALLDL
ncbi:MAG: 2-oxoglutarate dehydrogenase complex dihydrolipoyllysine-residue succinyltransferase [Bacteroidota bacterium]